MVRVRQVWNLESSRGGSRAETCRVSRCGCEHKGSGEAFVGRGFTRTGYYLTFILRGQQLSPKGLAVVLGGQNDGQMSRTREMETAEECGSQQELQDWVILLGS